MDWTTAWILPQGTPSPDAVSWCPRQTAMGVTSSSNSSHSSSRPDLHRRGSVSLPTVGFSEFLWAAVEIFPQLPQPFSTLWANTTNPSPSPTLNGQTAPSTRVLLQPLQFSLLWGSLPCERYTFSKPLSYCPESILLSEFLRKVTTTSLEDKICAYFQIKFFLKFMRFLRFYI